MKRQFRKWLQKFLVRFLKIFPPRNTLRVLLIFDNLLYYLEGQLAVAYGKGTHPKHRLTRYHEFFIRRIRSGEIVLDAGCGIGTLAYDIADQSQAYIVGIDIEPENISKARRQFEHPRIEFHVGDLLQDLPHQSFDVVVLSNILEHLPERKNFLKTLYQQTQAKRMLIRVPIYERDWRVPLKQELGIDWMLDPTHKIEYTVESFQDEFTAAGFSIAHLEVRWGEIWSEIRPIEN